MISKADQKTDTWMPLWIGAYLADTMKLTTLQHGAYMLLLMAYWRERAALVDSDDELRSITKTEKAEWKKLRPVLSKFFRVGDGVWWHKRVEAEIAAANSRKDAAVSKAKAGAQGRWKHGNGDASSNAPSNASSIPQAMLEPMLNRCPPPSPTPITSKEVSLSHSLHPDASDSDFENPGGTTPAGEVCKALKRIGIASVSPSHPELLALLKKGVTLAMFEDAATKTVAKSKGFSYMLAIVTNQLQAAADIEAGPSVAAEAWDANRQTIEAMGVRLGVGKWDETAVINREQFSAYTTRVRMAFESSRETVGA